jgi:hypothetical protein
MGLCERETIELREDGLEAGLPGDIDVLRNGEDMILRPAAYKERDNKNLRTNVRRCEGQ